MLDYRSSIEYQTWKGVATGETPREGTLYSIQALRALAAWMVVLHHYCMIFPVVKQPGWRHVFFDRGAVGVDVFFVVSGLVMGLSASDPRTTPGAFLAKRLARIVPAYWLFTVVVAALIVEAPRVMARQGYSPEFLLKSLLFVPAQNPSGLGMFPVNTVGWTLEFEMVFYVIVAASLFAKLPQRWLWIVMGLVVLQRQLIPLGAVGTFYSQPILYEFLLGIVAAHLWRSGALRDPGFLFACPAVLVAIVCIERAKAGGSPLRGLDWGVPSFLLVCAFLALERHFERALLLKHLGDHSYSVYLAHPPILYLGWYAHRVEGVNRALVSVVCLVAIALVGAGSYRFVEQPARRRLSRWLLSGHTRVRPASPS